MIQETCYKTFYKVLLLECDIFETEIVDERHFGSLEDAKAFVNLHKGLLTGIIIRYTYDSESVKLFPDTIEEERKYA